MLTSAKSYFRHGSDLDQGAGGGDAETDTHTFALPNGDILRTFIESQEENVDAVLSRTYIEAPPLDRSHPLQDYFISSSHNTYLSGNQLKGGASAEEYESVIARSARCVEFDCWPDTALGPPHTKITHGYTLTAHITLEDALVAVAKGMNESRSKLPVVISLENHTEDDEYQAGMVRQIHEKLKGRLVEGELADINGPVTLEHFNGRVFLMVEYHAPHGVKSQDLDNLSIADSDDESSSDSSDNEEAKQVRAQKKSAKGAVSPALERLGFYASSMKPKPGGDWVHETVGEDGPKHPIINISESHLLRLLKDEKYRAKNLALSIVEKTKTGLLRVYPKGVRVFSANADPLPFWRVGAQIVAMNFQTFDEPLQLNEALFSGTGGWVLKPPHLRSDGSPEAKRRRINLTLTLGGVSGLKSVLLPDNEKIRPFVKSYIQHSQGRNRFVSKTLPPSTTASVWNETYGPVEIEDDGLVFIRCVLKDDIKFASDDKLGTFSARLDYIKTQGWGIVRLLDKNGKESGCALAVKIEWQEI